jgi:hypothetical protein
LGDPDGSFHRLDLCVFGRHGASLPVVVRGFPAEGRNGEVGAARSGEWKDEQLNLIEDQSTSSALRASRCA